MRKKICSNETALDSYFYANYVSAQAVLYPENWVLDLSQTWKKVSSMVALFKYAAVYEKTCHVGFFVKI